MDLQHAKALFNKISALFDSIDDGSNKISTIERDLMLSYIRQLYETFLTTRAEAPAEQRPLRSTENPNSQTPFEVVAPENPKPPKKVSKPPKIIEIPDSLKDLEPAPPPRPKIKAKSIETLKPESKPEPRPIVSGKTNPTNNYNALFEFKAATELSEKLSERKIEDLSKSLAINDRLLYMNELFGKDPNTLNDALKLLNNYESLDDARGLLTNLAEQYDWLEEEKIPIAQGFIKLVRRRYI